MSETEKYLFLDLHWFFLRIPILALPIQWVDWLEVARKCVDLKIGENHIKDDHAFLTGWSDCFLTGWSHWEDNWTELPHCLVLPAVGGWEISLPINRYHSIAPSSSHPQVWFRLLPSGGRSLHMACAHCRDRSCCFFSQVSQTLVSHRTKTKLTDSPDTVNAALVRLFDQVSWGTWLLQRAPASFAKDFLLKW